MVRVLQGFTDRKHINGILVLTAARSRVVTKGLGVETIGSSMKLQRTTSPKCGDARFSVLTAVSPAAS